MLGKGSLNPPKADLIDPEKNVEEDLMLEKSLNPADISEADEKHEREDLNTIVGKSSAVSTTAKRAIADRLCQASFWTWMTIAGQTAVLSVALTFFVFIEGTRTPLAQPVADWARGSPRGLAYVVAGTSTVFSAMGTFFFSKALILFLTAYSNRPTSLFSFLTVTNLSRGTPLLSFHQINRTAISILGLMLLNSMNASFNTLLTPTPFTMKEPIHGREFNLNGDLFLDAVNNRTIASRFGVMTPAQSAENEKVTAAVKILDLNSAYSTAGRYLGDPSVLGYLGTTFNSSTGGIVPVIPKDPEIFEASPEKRSFTKFSSSKSPFVFDNPKFKQSRVFPFNYTVWQPGFTADVECRVLPANQSLETLGWMPDRETNVTLPDNTTRIFYNFLYKCPNKPVRSRSRLLRPRGSMVVTSTCPDQDFDGNTIPGSQLLFITGYGPMYQFLSSRVCQFTPYFTQSEVVYTGTVNVSRVISKVPITQKSLRISQYIFGGILDAMTQFLGDTRDKVGEDLYSLKQNAPIGKLSADELMNQILSQYLRAIIEARATTIKTPPILIWGRYLVASSIENLSDEWTSAFNGTWSYETLGWHRSDDSLWGGLLAIIPVLLITLSSIILAAHSWIVLRRSHHHRGKPFDPNDMITLLKAGKDGALVEIFEAAEESGKCQGCVKKQTAIMLNRNESEWEISPVVHSH